MVTWLAGLLAGVFLYLALRGIDWAVFLSSLRKANYGYIPFIFLWSSASHWVRAYRWRTLLTAERHISTKNVFWANLAGYLGNNLLPARAGELIRAVYVSKENNLSGSYSLATGLVERFIDLIALVLIGSTALAMAGILSQPLQDALRVMSVVALLGIIGILTLPRLGGNLSRIFAALPIPGTSAKEKLGKLLEQFLRGVEALHHPKRAAIFVLFTLLIWLMDGVGTVVIARALHLQFTFTAAFLLLAGIGLSSAIPSTPGYVGVYQFAAVLTLTPLGYSKAEAVALVLFMQILNLLVIVFWGMIAVTRFSRNNTEPGV